VDTVVFDILCTKAGTRTPQLDVAVARAFYQYAGDVPQEHWVSQIVVNTCLDQLKAEKVRALFSRQPVKRNRPGRCPRIPGAERHGDEDWIGKKQRFFCNDQPFFL
jgi:hypothetical protein